MEKNKIELRSDEIQEIIAKVPNWILRWGISLILFVIIIIFAISYFIKYPDVVVTNLKLTSPNTPNAIISKIDGKLMRLFVSDKTLVKKDQILAYLESTAVHDEVLTLEKNLENANVTYQNLGELQMAYQTYNQALIQYISYKNEKYLLKRKAFLDVDLKNLKNLYQNLNEQSQIQKEDFKLAENELQMHKKLLNQKVIAPLEYSREESKYLAKKIPLKNLESALISNSTAQTDKQKEILELVKTISEQKNIFDQAKLTFKSAIKAWKQKYVIEATTNGQLQFAGLIQEKMTVSNNQPIFYISSSNDNYFGSILIPQQNFGKVKIDQNVIIKFNSYPYQEFGMIEGQIKSIAEIPTLINNTEFYLANVTFNKGLITNFNKKIIFREGMVASAEIITEDLRLIDRLFYQIRKVFSR